MSVALLILSVVILGFIAWQDFRERAVSVWALTLLTIAQLLSGFIRSGSETLLRQSAQNALITLSLLTMVWIYDMVKNRKLINLFKNGVGTADLLLLFILGTALPTFIFVFVILIGFILALICTLVVNQVRTPREQTIPLAGYLSVWAILLIILSMVFPQYPLHDDEWLIFILTGNL